MSLAYRDDENRGCLARAKVPACSESSTAYSRVLASVHTTESGLTPEKSGLPFCHVLPPYALGVFPALQVCAPAATSFRVADAPSTQLTSGSCLYPRTLEHAGLRPDWHERFSLACLVQGSTNAHGVWASPSAD